MKPDDPGNIQKLGDGFEPAWAKIDTAAWAGGKLSVTDDSGAAKEYGYAELLQCSTVSCEGLKVKSVYTTNNEGSSSNGAMTLTCEAPDGTEVSVRTVVLYDDAGKIITSERYEGKTIDVRGVVDYYNGGYQIKVFSDSKITVH